MMSGPWRRMSSSAAGSTSARGGRGGRTGLVRAARAFNWLLSTPSVVDRLPLEGQAQPFSPPCGPRRPETAGATDLASALAAGVGSPGVTFLARPLPRRAALAAVIGTLAALPAAAEGN